MSVVTSAISNRLSLSPVSGGLRLLVSGVLALTIGNAQAAQCTIQSAAQKQPLVELYTSEGCNSCPPAERWLGQRFGSTDPQAIALAFHVVYWDYLGWKDKWAKPEFTQRQKFLSARQGLSGIYTPGVFLSGKEWRRWGGGLTQQDMDNISRQPARAVLRLEQDSLSGSVSVKARALDGNAQPNWDLYVASTLAPFSSKVTAGENHGETLQHAHVVRQLAGPFNLQAGGSLKLDSQDEAVVAFVQDRANGEVLQAVKARAVVKFGSCG